jgi:hypothetical protein
MAEDPYFCNIPEKENTFWKAAVYRLTFSN